MNRAVVGIVAVLLLAGLTAVGSGATQAAISDDISQGSPTESSAAQVLDSDSNETEDRVNETIRHRHPDDIDDDDEDLGGWLADQLSTRLGESTIELSEGQYEFARDLLGDDYDDQVRQFVEVTDADDDDEDTLTETGDKQEELADLLEEFEDTREAYEQALEEGEADRARELARELVALAEQIEGVVVDLEELLAEIEALLGDDFSAEIESIATIAEEVTNVREGVIDELLTETTLTVQADEPAFSVEEPLVVTGQLETDDGEPVANESVTLAINGEHIDVDTDRGGTFSFEYDPPPTLELATETMLVEYVPAAESDRLGSEDSVSVALEQVMPEINVSVTPETVRYGDTIQADGDITAHTTAVDDVTLTLSVADDELGSIVVEDGLFSDSIQLPADIPSGEQRLSVELPFEDRALAGAGDSATVTVEETETRIDVEADSSNSSSPEIQVGGLLETIDSQAVTEEQVEVLVEGAPVDAVSTDSDGQFNDTVELPDTVDDEDVAVAIVYQGSGNLAPSQAETTVTVPGLSESESSSILPLPVDSDTVLNLPDTVVDSDTVLNLPARVVLLLVTVLLLSIGGVWWYRYTNESAQTPSAPQGTELSQATTHTDSEPDSTQRTLEEAQDTLEAGQIDLAVQLCYASVRRHLTSQIEIQNSLTHWEFFHACAETDDQQSLGADVDEALRDVTAIYEQAAYSTDGPSLEDGKTALNCAQKLCKRD